MDVKAINSNYYQPNFKAVYVSEDAVLSEKKATAKKLLERGMTAQEAAEITGLSQEEVEKLNQQE